MKNNELIEMAGKAAGIELEYCPASGFHWVTSKYSGLWFDPINIDGDAFRLMAKLDIDISFDDWHVVADYKIDSTASVIGVAYEGDKLAATRRAITEAASRIGLSIK